MIQAFAIKDNDKPLRVVNEPVFKEQTNTLPQGRYQIIVKKYAKNKSNAQLGYLFACIYPFVLRGLNDLGWEIASLDEVDALCKDRFANKEIVNINTGEVMSIPALKRDMTTSEFSAYVEAIRKFASEVLGVTIPDPEVNIEIEFK